LLNTRAKAATMANLMPKIDFEQRVLDRVRTARDRMEAEGRLLPRDTLAKYLERFRAKYGADVLQGLDGAALLDGMHGRKSKDSLVYWLEFKNDEDFVSPPLGSIQGGSALKFGVYQATETGSWMTGSPQQQKVISVEQAIEIARRQRGELLAAVAVLSALGPTGSVNPDEVDYALLDQKLRSAMPTLYGAGWAHKYLALLFPDRIDDYHSYDYQRFHLVRLLLLPPEGRYAAAQPFITLARALDEPVQRASAVLNDLHGGPYSYWRVGTVIDGTSGWEGMRQGGYAAVGWPAFGDLTDMANGELDRDTWNARFKQHYAHEHAPTESNLRGQLLDFIRNARERDVVVAADGQRALGIGGITGPYEHRPDTAPFAHARPVEWRTDEPWSLEEGLQTTFRKLKKPETWLAIERRLFDRSAIPRPVGPIQGPTPSLPPLDPTVARVDRILRRKGQVILYGPPGTGKTYWGERAACELASRAWFGRAFDPRDALRRAELLATGAIEMCSFHPAYGYEDFLEGYRPSAGDGGAMHFALRDGVFKRLCERAAAQSKRPFYLLIDEINRGDIPRIFGELLSALEWDKRGKSFTLPLSGRPFAVPENVFVIGTMNTADRSIALLDAALRRRFGFVELMPSPEALRATLVQGLPLGAWLTALNRRILQHVGRDARNLQVGHAYLLERGAPVSNPDRFVEVLQEDVVPLLQEYCYEDFPLLAKILGPKLVNVEQKRIEEALFEPAHRAELFDALLAAFPEVSTSSEAVSGVEAGGADDPEEPSA
jgi:5-methylcytosine-specific restriction protein B